MVTYIPNVQNWTVTPQNGQPSYFTLMNTWLGQSTLVIASLQTAIVAQNKANSEINDLAIQTENNAIVANGLANFQGAWSGATTYSKGQSVESTTGSKIYYTSKVDNNLNHSVTDTYFWLSNPINDKLNTDFSLLTDKTTPADTDIFAIRETGGLLKKNSWANIKTSLSTLFISKVTTPIAGALAKINSSGSLVNSNIINKDNGHILIGTTTDNGLDVLQVNGSFSMKGGLIIYPAVDINLLKTYTQVINVNSASTNLPIAEQGYLEVIVYDIDSKWVMQRFTAMGFPNANNAGRTFVRCWINNISWSAWREL